MADPAQEVPAEEVAAPAADAAPADGIYIFFFTNAELSQIRSQFDLKWIFSSNLT